MLVLVVSCLGSKCCNFVPSLKKWYAKVQIRDSIPCSSIRVIFFITIKKCVSITTYFFASVHRHIFCLIHQNIYLKFLFLYTYVKVFHIFQVYVAQTFKSILLPTFVPNLILSFIVNPASSMAVFQYHFRLCLLPVERVFSSKLPSHGFVLEGSPASIPATRSTAANAKHIY